MIASSFLDPVLGIDIHFEMVPMPAPVPTPIPNPFTGIVFDPLGLACGIALGAAIGAVLGAPFQGPVLYWTAFPATNTGTEAKHVPGHILIPPGTAWAPFPKTPKPVIHPGETPAPALPVKPENDAVVVFGSKTVTVMGSNAVRLGDIALSCSEPLRLPSSVVLAVPKGAPILIGGPMSLDIMAAIMASLRTRFVSDSLHALLSRLKPSRFRNLLNRVVCFFTGHPVDVASGKVMTDNEDLRIPGPIPLVFERVYSSAFASRSGPLGHGWSHSWDQAVWRERGKVVLRAEDGREIEFDTFDFPNHTIAPGQSVRNPIERLTLHCDTQGRWRVVDHHGRTREFGPVSGRPTSIAPLYAIATRGRTHSITFAHDAGGRVATVTDTGGRTIHLQYDANGRVAALLVPGGGGHRPHRTFAYDAHGDLVRVTDALGNSWSFEYVGHLLVRETDRCGLSFYFQYDGLGEDAHCVRTWGDKGIYDHVLAYDKKKHITFVTDSRGLTTQYHLNLVGQVIKVVDPKSGITEYSYDPVTLQKIGERRPDGSGFEHVLDAAGNVAQIDRSDGTSTRLAYGPFNQISGMRSESGAVRIWEYDDRGLATRTSDSSGLECAYSHSHGQLCRISRVDGAVMTIEYGSHALPVHARTPSGAEFTYSYDELGRVLAVNGPQGTRRLREYDVEGRVLREADSSGVTTHFRYDAEGHIVERADPRRRIAFRYGGFHDLIEREEDGARASFAYDTEGHVTEITTPDGERFGYTYDPLGRVEAETDPRGRVTAYARDAGGRIVEQRAANNEVTTYEYDAGSRLARTQRADGTFLELTHRVDGSIVRAATEMGAVEMEWDASGRLVAERSEAAEIRIAWAANGQRGRTISSLGLDASYVHDAMGGPAAMRMTTAGQAADHRTISYRRDAVGAEIARWLPGGVVVGWQRDVGGRPLRRVVQTRADAGAAQLISDRRWTWNGEALVAMQDGSGIRRRFHHAGMGRVDAEADDGGEYRVRAGWGSAWTRGSMGRVEAGPGARYEHDELGRRIAKIEADGGRWTYGWNGHGFLTTVVRPDGTRIEYDYDALGRRIRKRSPVGETRYVWDGDFLVHELPPDAPAITWYWDLDSHTLAAREQAGEVVSFGSDPLGAPVQAFDEHGELRWSTDLDLAGRVIREDGDASLCPWRMVGQYEDEETGLYYNRFRYYDPECGQYISSDPLGLQVGTFRTYDYVDDPLTWADPLGLIQGPTQVPYDDHDMFEGPGGVKETAGAMSDSATSSGNLAVARLDDGTLVPMMSEPPAGRPQRPRNVFHSEYKLLNGDIDPRRIVAIYTEREPCKGCLDDLRRLLGRDVPVTFTHPHVPGGESAVSKEIRDSRRACR